VKKTRINTALDLIRRRFIGGFRGANLRTQSKYMPHQGEREKSRRIRQMGEKN